MNWLIGLAAVAFLYWFFVLRPGRLDFWKVAAQNPDAVYDHFVSASCWKVFEDGLPENYQDIVPESDWVGPFRLLVPKLGGKQIVVFGKHPEHEQSQDIFLQNVNRRSGRAQ